jgi:hypothetical protein
VSLELDDINAIQSVVDACEKKLEKIRRDADNAERDFQAILETRKQLVSVFNAISSEHERRSRAIRKYNTEVETIAKYGKKALELSRTPLPIMAENLPSVAAAVRGKKEIHALVHSNATEVKSLGYRACGVYFLLLDDEIVYIGQSVDCFQRVSTHARDESKTFNRACYVSVPKEELDDIESVLIALFKPVHNSRGVTNHADESLALFNMAPMF